jgi:hypothetical protein
MYVEQIFIHFTYRQNIEEVEPCFKIIDINGIQEATTNKVFVYWLDCQC